MLADNPLHSIEPMKRPALTNFRRIVVKVGSSLLIDSDAGEVRSSWLAALAADIAKLHGEGRDVLVVSSGSIALGRSRLKLPREAAYARQKDLYRQYGTTLNGLMLEHGASPDDYLHYVHDIDHAPAFPHQVFSYHA